MDAFRSRYTQDTEDYLAANQHLNNWQAYPWQQPFLDLSEVNDTTISSLDDLMLCDYPVSHKSKEWPEQDDVLFGFTDSAIPSPQSLESELESPTSESSLASAEDLFNDAVIDPTIISGDLYNGPAAARRATLSAVPDLPFSETSQPQSRQSSVVGHVLSPAEIQELWAIAMPDAVKHPESLDSSSSSEPEIEDDSPFSSKRQARKRPQVQQSAKPKNRSLSKQQTAHNIIEKRYRNNLNNKIAALRDSVPSLRIPAKEGSSDRESVDGNIDERNKPHKLNKATVLSKAIEYISQLEKINKVLSEENMTAKSKNKALEGIILVLKKRRHWD